MPKKIKELLEKRTYNSKHFLNDDGTKTAEISMGIIHYEDENGNFQDIDTSLIDENDISPHGNISKHALDINNIKKQKISNKDDLDFQALKVPYGVKIPRFFDRGYTIGKGNDKLTFIPINVNKSKVNITENKALYENVWENTDVELEILSNKVKETIIIKDESSPTSFRFEVKGKLVDDLTSGELKIENAWLEDANGEKRDVYQTINNNNDKIYLDMVADVIELTYPIKIDPTITIQPSSQDSYTASAYAVGNYGTSTTMRVGYDGSNIYYSQIQHDLSALASISADSILTATLDLTVNGTYAMSTTTKTTIWVENILSSWSETGVTWNNLQADTANPISSAVFTGTMQANSLTSFDIKNWLSDVLNNSHPNYGIQLAWKSFSGTGGYFNFYTLQYSTVSYRPKITVNYNEPPSAPTVISPNGGEQWNHQNNITWNPSSVKLSPLSTIENNQSSATMSMDASPGYGSSQIFTANVSGLITKAAIRGYIDIGNATSVKLRIQTLDSNGLPDNNNILSEVDYSLGISDPGAPVDVTLPSPCKITNGTQYALVLYNSSANSTARWQGSNTNTYGDGYPVIGGMNWTTSNKQTSTDGYFRITIEEGILQSDLQYQPQLSKDNGSTWKDLITEGYVYQEDKTVIDEAYDTSGNGGRKLVILDNGWLVTGFYENNTTKRADFYISKDNGLTWSLLCYCTTNNYGFVGNISLVSKGTTVYVIGQLGSIMNTIFLKFDASTQTNIDLYSTLIYIDTGQSGINSNSLIINNTKTELHATWSSKNSTYPNSYNIRYIKGTINTDSSITWGSVVQVGWDNTNGFDHKNPSIILDSNNNVHIIHEYDGGGSTFTIMEYSTAYTTKNFGSYVDSNWGSCAIYQGGSYAQSSPSAIFVPQSINGLVNGRICVTWQGIDSTDTSKYNIHYGYSDDGGITWITSKLTSGNSYQRNYPSITVNKNNEIFIVYLYDITTTDNRLIYLKNSNNSWDTEIQITSTNTNGIYYHPSTIADTSLDFKLPPLITNDDGKVSFYGSWYTSSNLTDRGITNLSYDFTNESASNQSLIRVRAYDGILYGDWDQSDSVFSIIHKIQTGVHEITKGDGSILLIPIYDPNIGMDTKNQLRGPDKNGNISCFELVDITDPNASPIRVMTSGGIKAISK